MGMKKTTSPVIEDRARAIVNRRKGSTVEAGNSKNLVSELGWTRDQAEQVRASLGAFDSDWDAPGMEEYDRL
jgi:hypothetical protein